MPTERRAHPRKLVTAPYAANILSPDGTVLGIAVPVDVSQGGFRADTSRDYGQGEGLRLTISGSHQLAGRQFPFVVAWSAQVTEGWQLGGQFTDVQTGEVIARLAGS